jgi:hypothetical protein
MPMRPGAVHVSFGEAHAAVQHTLLTQNPEVHWLPVTQLSPSGMGVGVAGGAGVGVGLGLYACAKASQVK